MFKGFCRTVARLFYALDVDKDTIALRVELVQKPHDRMRLSFGEMRAFDVEIVVAHSVADSICHRRFLYLHPVPPCEMYEKRYELHFQFCQQKKHRWYERGDLNPQGVSRWILSPVRLPIPPLSHEVTIASLNWRRK